MGGTRTIGSEPEASRSSSWPIPPNRAKRTTITYVSSRRKETSPELHRSGGRSRSEPRDDGVDREDQPVLMALGQVGNDPHRQGDHDHDLEFKVGANVVVAPGQVGKSA